MGNRENIGKIGNKVKFGNIGKIWNIGKIGLTQAEHF